MSRPRCGSIEESRIPDAAAAALAAGLIALADQVPANDLPVLGLARQRAADAAATAAAAIGADPTLAERHQRELDVLGELLRRLTPLTRQATSELERRRAAAADASTARPGRTSPVAPEELDAVSQRCTEIAAQLTAAVLPDWNTPRRIRELSASRMPGGYELADIAARLRLAVAPALDLSCPDPEAVRLADLADQIAPARTDRPSGQRLA